MSYKSGDYFGELALLNKDCMRKASIVVTSEEAVVIYLTKRAFKRLLGPLEEVLGRKAEEYKKFENA